MTYPGDDVFPGGTPASPADVPSTFGDIEGLLPAWLQGVIELDLDGLIVCTETDDELETNPATVQLVRAGGPSSFTLEKPRIVATSFAGDRIAARDLAGRVDRAFRWLLRGTILGGQLVVSKVDVVSGPSWVPDPNMAVRKYVATYSITARRFG